MSSTSTRGARTTLGPHFSEGARRLWMYMRATQQSGSALAAQLGVTRGALSRFLLGERCPSRESAVRIERVTGIAPSLFDDKPTERFRLPRSVRAARPRTRPVVTPLSKPSRPAAKKRVKPRAKRAKRAAA